MAVTAYSPQSAGDPVVGVVKRISWGAIFAGGVVALVIQLTLGLLGLGIGMSTVNPVEQSYPFAGLGIGAGIWFVVSSIISLFAGGWVAGRLAGIPKTKDSVLHGVVTWSVVTLLSFYLLTTAVGRVIGGTANVVGQGLAMAGQGVAAVAPQVAGVAQEQLQAQGITIQGVMEEARTLTQVAGQEADQAGIEINQLISRVLGLGGETPTQQDREALANILAQRTDMNRQEAQQTVARWEQTAAQVRQQTQQTLAAAEQQAREAGEAVAAGVTRASLWSFAALILGAASAGFGGKVGKPSRLSNATLGATRRDEVV